MPPSRIEDCFSHELFRDISKEDYINKFGYPNKIFICLSPEWIPE